MSLHHRENNCPVALQASHHYRYLQRSFHQKFKSQFSHYSNKQVNGSFNDFSSQSHWMHLLFLQYVWVFSQDVDQNIPHILLQLHVHLLLVKQLCPDLSQHSSQVCRIFIFLLRSKLFLCVTPASAKHSKQPELSLLFWTLGRLLLLQFPLGSVPDCEAQCYLP